jgi:gamma-glutamylcyclotransferase (GGCT)/AIG2-like uncharacterized protein YtfP
MMVFIYGTLKKNGENHSLIKKEKFITPAYIHGYLYDLGVGVPAVEIENTRDKVYGELYEIDDDFIDELDEFEGFSPDNAEDSIYSRVEVEVLTDDRKTYQAQVYAMDQTQLSRFFAVPIKKGSWQ